MAVWRGDRESKTAVTRSVAATSGEVAEDELSSFSHSEFRSRTGKESDGSSTLKDVGGAVMGLWWFPAAAFEGDGGWQ